MNIIKKSILTGMILCSYESFAQIKPPEASSIFRDSKVAAMAENLAKGDYNAVMLAKSQGVDINSKGKEGIRPIHYVASWAHEQSVGSLRALVSAGAETNVTDDSGRTPLGISAARSGHTAISVLVGAGARPSDPSQGKLPAIIAAESKQEVNFEILVNSGTPLVSPLYNSGTLAGDLSSEHLFESLAWLARKNLINTKIMPNAFWINVCNSNDSFALEASKILTSRVGSKGCMS